MHKKACVQAMLYLQGSSYVHVWPVKSVCMVLSSPGK